MPLVMNRLTGVKCANLPYNPTLESVLMVENMLEKFSGEFTIYHFWQKLPRKMTYQSFKIIISYLLGSNKITFDRKKKIVWIWNPELINKLEKSGMIKYE